MSSYILLRWNSIINVIIFLLLGLLLLIFPVESLNIGGYLIASILLLAALGYFIIIIKNKGIETNADIFYLLLSLVFIGLSISIFLDPTWIIRTINIFVGVILIVNSIMNIISMFKLKKNRTKSFWVYFGLIVIIFIFGIVVIVDPLFLSKIIVRIEGATMIINSIITFLVSRKVNKIIEKQTEETNLVKSEK